MNIKELSKEEKEKLRIELLNSNESFMYHKASRMFNASVFGLILSILLIVLSIFVEKTLWGMIYDFGLFTFCAIIVCKTANIKKQELNKFLKNSKKNEEIKVEKPNTEKRVINKKADKSKVKAKDTKSKKK